FDQTEMQTLGQRWRLTEPGLLFKSYPVCSAAHALIEQTVALVDEARCNADAIERIVCEVPKLVGISLIYDEPATAQEMQFSVPFAVACAVLHRGVRLEDIGLDALKDPAIRSMMGRTEKRVDPKLSTEEMRIEFPESARVTICLRDGRQLSGFCGAAYGMPQCPLSDDALKAKFCNCLVFAGHTHDFAAGQADTLLNPEAGQKADFCRVVQETFDVPDAVTSQTRSF
ncbi:MAG: hypothetical protein AAF479_16795, partial [Pseudomonadota bacterium]